MEWSSVLGFKGLGPQCVFSIGHELKWNGWGVEYQTSPSLLFCAAAAYFKRVSSTPTPRAESKLLRRIHKFTCQKIGNPFCKCIENRCWTRLSCGDTLVELGNQGHRPPHTYVQSFNEHIPLKRHIDSMQLRGQLQNAGPGKEGNFNLLDVD